MDIEETYANPEIYGKSAHSWLVTGIIKNTGQIRGHAPGCTVYMANPATPSVLHTADAIEKMLDTPSSLIQLDFAFPSAFTFDTLLRF